VPNSETQTICPNIKLYELFEYRSAFLPEGGLDIVENDWRFNAKPFGYQPAAAFISGEGSEGGADISKASRMKQTATGEFEVYTYLLAGKPFYFTDGNTGSYRKFYTTGDNLLKEDGSTTVSTEGIYRITLNFNAGTSTYTLVTRLGFFFSPSNAVLFDLDYMGNGVFQKRATVTFKQESWGRDERYKFRMFVRENGGADAERQLEWATLNTTDSRPTATSPESYYYMRLIDLLTQWDNKWKLMADFDGVEATYTVYLNTDKANYTHTIQK
jgi:hypothetical protein